MAGTADRTADTAFLLVLVPAVHLSFQGPMIPDIVEAEIVDTAEVDIVDIVEEAFHIEEDFLENFDNHHDLVLAFSHNVMVHRVQSLVLHSK